jgi:predicted ArsR family transcriptional regulator
MQAPKVPGAISDTQTRTLLALIELRARTGYASVRDIAAIRGMSLMGIHKHLSDLSRAGLVDIGTHGALRSLVAPVRLPSRHRRR